MYKSLARKLGITEMGCYSLRHEFATFLAQVEKCDQETQKQLMGWSTFIDSYLHTDDTYKRKALSKIDSQYAIKNSTIKHTNIIQFPFSKSVNQ